MTYELTILGASADGSGVVAVPIPPEATEGHQTLDRSTKDKDASSKLDEDVTAYTTQADVDPQTNSSHRKRRLINFATLCWCFILEGWNDGSLGPLVPKMQTYYHVEF